MARTIGHVERIAGVMTVMLTCVSMAMTVSARHAPGPYHEDVPLLAPTPFARAPDSSAPTPAAYSPEGAPLSSPVASSPPKALASYPAAYKGETPAAPIRGGF